MTSLEKHNWVAALPNALSVSRGLLALTLPFFMLSPSPLMHVLALVVFIIAAVTDYYDGYVARRFNLISDSGKIMDPTMDKVLILIPLAVFSHMGFYSYLWILPIFLREIVVTFCRVAWMLEGQAIGAEKAGKLKFVFQVTLLSASFTYLILSDYQVFDIFLKLIRTLVLISLYISVFLTIYSGLTFLRTNRALFKNESFAKFTSALGVGLLPVAPGTWGSALAVVLAWSVHSHAWLYSVVMFGIAALGYWAVKRLDLTKTKDPGFVVVDEACGIFITFAGLPMTFWTMIIGFLLFRLFDIVKPPPLRRLEKFPGYWGILLDDLGAGVYAWLTLLLFCRMAGI